MHGNNARNLSVQISSSQTSKNAMFFLIISCFILNKIREQKGRTGSAWKGWGEVAQIMYTHVSKCKNYKIKLK
jgi:hypothetical protein